MKNPNPKISVAGTGFPGGWRRVFIAVALFSLLMAAPRILRADEPGKAFATPQEAVDALGAAVATTNRTALAELFGPDSDWIVNPDPVQGEHELENFKDAFEQTNHLERSSDTNMILNVGPHDWPFPLPLVKGPAGWYFDAAAGREEILDRRIGRNELETLSVVRAYVEAQREYASSDRDDSQVRKYAQKIRSSPGKTDGLCWPLELNGQESPLGPLVAEAQAEGYFKNEKSEDTNNAAEPQSFHGYFFKILTRQGEHVPGGKYDYVINGNMIGGFGLVAWPAEYGESGIMTFVVNQRGKVYEKDLGTNTEQMAQDMKEYNPDSTWQVSKD